MISIPSDLRKNKDTIIGNMNLRECICLFLGLFLALGILYYIRVILGYRRIVIAAFIGGIFLIPFLFIGFKKINGMTIDDYFKVFVNNNILANKIRINICPYAETQVKNKKYELIRYYKLKLRKEAIVLRELLKEKKTLILTEYINYNSERYVIFRLDGKDLILNQIKRNKELIDSKKKEIKDFTKNVVKKIKKEKIKLTKKNKASRKRQYTKIKELRKERLNNLNAKNRLLKSELRLLKSKTYNDLKEEVDIFDGISNIRAERILVKESNKKKKELVEKKDLITKLREALNNDERKLCQLHLFNKESFRDFINSLKNKIVFVNDNNGVDVYYYDIGASEIVGEREIVGASTASPEIYMPAGCDFVVDVIEIDKKSGLYESTILSLEARNFYNHYRSINDLEEIL